MLLEAIYYVLLSSSKKFQLYYAQLSIRINVFVMTLHQYKGPPSHLYVSSSACIWEDIICQGKSRYNSLMQICRRSLRRSRHSSGSNFSDDEPSLDIKLKKSRRVLTYMMMVKLLNIVRVSAFSIDDSIAAIVYVNTTLRTMVDIWRRIEIRRTML